MIFRAVYLRVLCLWSSTPRPPSHFHKHLQDHELCNLYVCIRSHNDCDHTDNCTPVPGAKAAHQGNGYVQCSMISKYTAMSVWTLGTINASTPYLSIVAMLVESYALDSAWSFVAALLFILGSSGISIVAPSDSAIKVCNFVLFPTYFIQPLWCIGHCLLPCRVPCCNWAGMDRGDWGKDHEFKVEPQHADFHSWDQWCSVSRTRDCNWGGDRPSICNPLWIGCLIRCITSEYLLIY